MKVPEFLHLFFWDCDPDRIDDEGHAPFVVTRLMERGTLAAMQWLPRRYPRERLVEILRTRGVRVLPARELNYWAFVCGVPDDERRRWVHQARAGSWRRPYAG